MREKAYGGGDGALRFGAVCVNILVCFGVAVMERVGRRRQVKEVVEIFHGVGTKQMAGRRTGPLKIRWQLYLL